MTFPHTLRVWLTMSAAILATLAFALLLEATLFARKAAELAATRHVVDTLHQESVLVERLLMNYGRYSEEFDTLDAINRVPPRSLPLEDATSARIATLSQEVRSIAPELAGELLDNADEDGFLRSYGRGAKRFRLSGRARLVELDVVLERLRETDRAAQILEASATAPVPAVASPIYLIQVDVRLFFTRAYIGKLPERRASAPRVPDSLPAWL